MNSLFSGQMFPRRSIKGFTLLELLLAMALTSLTIFGLMRLQNILAYGAADNAKRAFGIYVADEVVDRMRANSEGLSSYEAAFTAGCPSGGISAACDAGAIRTPAVLASCDAAEILCLASVNTKVSNLSIALDCTNDAGNDVGCEEGRNASLTVAWQERAGVTASFNLQTRL